METDETTEPVQSEEVEDQGGDGHDAPYREYLDRIPEEARDEAEEAFKAWDADTTRKFQEASEYRKNWEPYEQSGINQFPVEDVQWMVQFRQALDDPQAVKQWYESYAQQAGLATDEPAKPQAEQGVPFDEFMGADPQQLQNLLKQELTPLQQQVEQFAEWRQQQEYAQRVSMAEAQIESQLEEIKAQHPDQFNREAIENFAGKYVNTDPEHAVQRGFADWQKVVAQIERDALQGKADAPAPAEAGGVAAATPEAPSTLEEANKQALERIRETMRS